ncbi:DNA-binding transcriptional regulator, ArsR family [Rhizobium sp. NFR07]|uniref:ArsR/SmtB family transcription factor n=1 Tax=Rhizobium sp. NFR07 TaxID=1566262 RepID=UPI0008F142F3|nr:metalloregulator ArsR/SmtB family transcription factor [Rhizobium sp. NFR07]SFB59171.1 DNA-binding transcriptional regulator, ArsR family [Rhizobium sp. NFR07]
MTSNLDFDTAADFLSVLANGNRLQIFRRLTDREWDVGSLAKELNLSQSALSQHLKRMRELKLVETRREAQTIFYYCQSAAVVKILLVLSDIAETDGGGSELAA